VRVKEIIPTEASLMRVVVVVFCDGHLSIFTDSMSKTDRRFDGIRCKAEVV
jgi:hypothetical protein